MLTLPTAKARGFTLELVKAAESTNKRLKASETGMPVARESCNGSSAVIRKLHKNFEPWLYARALFCCSKENIIA